jgi:hypothetical protein
VRISSRSRLGLLCLGFAIAGRQVASAQNSASAAALPPVIFTADQDHQNMMDQLGIKALRPGPSGDERAPNHANYDESKANPYPNLPDPLTLNDGQNVTTSQMWWDKRRPEIVEMYEKYVYDNIPKDVPKVMWSVTVVDREMIGFNRVIAKDLIGQVDNSSYPAISVKIHMTLVTPANAAGPVPILIMFGRAGFPAPNEPAGEDLDRINAAWKALLVQQDPSLKDVLTNHPAWQPVRPTPFQAPQLNADGDPPNTWQLIAAGWGFAPLDPASVQADDGAGITRGIIGLVNKGQPRKPNEWGALRAWSWGAGRALDYLVTDPSVDAKHVGIEGVSRYGKAALVTMAFDQRFAMVLVGSSGKGGATLLRRNYGEAVESLTGGEYYWIPTNSSLSARRASPSSAMEFQRRATRTGSITREVSWRPWMRAVCLPCSVPRASTLRGIITAKMPPVNEGILAGQLAWRQHDGGHTDAPNMKYFIQWADKFIGHTPPQS